MYDGDDAMREALRESQARMELAAVQLAEALDLEDWSLPGWQPTVSGRRVLANQALAAVMVAATQRLEAVTWVEG